MLGDSPSRYAKQGTTVFENLASQERIDLAKKRMTKVVDHFLYLIELHANNSYAVYSPALSSQIPKSYAANAFFVFQQHVSVRDCPTVCSVGPRGA